MVAKQAPTTTRQRLIDAAMRVLRSGGAAGLTLDRVAAEAHISKGGLLHHFGSKNALSAAILEQLFADFAARVELYLAREPERAGRLLRAYVHATFEDDPLPLEVAALLLSSVVENKELLEQIRADWEHWQRRLLDDGVAAPRALVIRQAADAYWTELLIEPTPMDATQRAAVRDELLRLSEVDAP